MKKNYEFVEVELVVFGTEDVIRTSEIYGSWDDFGPGTNGGNGDGTVDTPTFG
jgi:hypothetical protein